MNNSLVPAPQIAALQSKNTRLREALTSCGMFFSAARQSDPLPHLRDLTADWLLAEEVMIVVPATAAPPVSDDPTQLSGPITIGRRVVGRIDATRSRPFESEDRAMLAALGQIVGAVLEQASLQSQIGQYCDQAQANADTLDQLLTFGRLVVSATADPQSLALQLATQVPSMVGGERASLLIIPPDDPDAPQLILSTGSISSVERAREVRDNGMAGMVLRSRVPMIVDETDTDRRWVSLTAREYDSPTRCAMAVPLIWGERLLGALTVTTTRTHLFDTPQLNLLELVACHISLAIHAATQEMRLQNLGAALRTARIQMESAIAELHVAVANADSAAVSNAISRFDATVARLTEVEHALRARTMAL